MNYFPFLPLLSKPELLQFQTKFSGENQVMQRYPYKLINLFQK